MTHAFITIAAELPRDQESQATQTLDALGNPLKEPFADVIHALNRIHFFSMSVVPGDEQTPPFLVLELSADGAADDVLALLADKAGAYFEPVFQLTKDYTPSTRLLSFWKSHSITTGLGYMDTPGLGHTGTPGMSVERIRKEAELAQTVTAIYCNTDRSGSALDVVERVREELRKDAVHDWALTPEPTDMLRGERNESLITVILKSWPGFISTFLWPFFLLSAALSFWMFWPQINMAPGTLAMSLAKVAITTGVTGSLLSLIFIAWVYTSLRSLETRDVPDDSCPDHERLEQVRQREDHAYQNHMSGVSIMKEGKIRQITIRLIFFLIAVLATRSYRPGFLGSIGTIHFARWVMLPGTNRLLFFSNYGGSWESYLEDFITKANFGLTGVWGNTIGFPKTTNLVFDGASDGDRFKRWARRQQYPTWCWYSAYPGLTTARIRTHAAIRQGIAGIATETEARDWMMLFGSEVLPRNELQSDNIQALLFGGFGPLPHATCLTLQLPGDVHQARAWLENILPYLRFGDNRPTGQECATILALSATGLQKLGLSDSNMATFPHAFIAGMAQRARFLGDTADSEPSNWQWGGAKAVDATLLLYGPDASTLNQLVAQETSRVEHYGLAVVHAIALQELPPKGTALREPFGFVDGVSQPVIRGIGRHKPGTNDHHILEPGEFILGYPDGLGTYPQTPTVPAIQDAHNDLYTLPTAWPEQRPDFSDSLAMEARDLGRDGSFIVIRQLEQDVSGFWSFLDEAAKRLGEGSTGIAVTPEWIAAKMVGRWPDGSSLVRNPYSPASENNPQARPDNDFLFGKEDPQGMRCPFGSHIRRTNPRESQDPKSEFQIAITNRHRILRAGRVYEENGKQGLLFVCLNGDIERQFEFIQQTWINNATFHGLDGETDPFFNGNKDGKYTIPMRDGSRCVTGIENFITTRGGEYFFLPGRQALRFLSRPL